VKSTLIIRFAPFYFETDDWENLWKELKSILLYWIEQGVKIFRVDNPHTKPFRFWKWLIAEIKAQHPEVLFLSEAFTRPKIMYQLAKIGFTQSYTYFSWRNSKAEMVEYMNELTKDEPKEFFRPNFWPNTPDINPYILQTGKESHYITRYVLAATLSSNYGLYGPVYDFIIHQPIAGKEEYADSEKYEIYNWDWKHNNKMMDVMRTVNFARKREEALQETNNLVICNNDHGEILAYYKSNSDKSSEILVVVNFNSNHKVSSWIQLPLKEMGIKAGAPIMMVDLFTNAEYRWQNEWNYVELDPNVLPFHLFKIKRG
jgi:starch synthase (maltosyl-transferring)